MNRQLFKRYILVFVVSVILLTLFYYLENDNDKYSIKINHNKGLSEKSKQIIKSFTQDKSIKFEVYTSPKSFVAKKIVKFLKPYTIINNSIIVKFIDPISNPSMVKQNAITMQGEILLSFTDEQKFRQIYISELSETAVINSLLKLQNNREEWLVFAEGYGMNTVDDDTDTGLSQLLFNLKKSGYHVARMPLSTALNLPDNVKIIVIPAPMQQLDNDIVNWLQQQMDKGISIWWLPDVDASNQNYLELALDTVLGDKQLLKAQAYTSSMLSSQTHAITENFNQPIFLAEAIEVINQGSKVFIKSANNTPIAIAKQNSNNRLVITGDVNFITNQYINVAANKSLSIRIIDWLFYHDDRVNIATEINQNTQLYMTQKQLIFISVLFLILLPFLLLFITWKQWSKGRA